MGKNLKKPPSRILKAFKLSNIILALLSALSRFLALRRTSFSIPLMQALNWEVKPQEERDLSQSQAKDIILAFMRMLSDDIEINLVIIMIGISSVLGCSQVKHIALWAYL